MPLQWWCSAGTAAWEWTWRPYPGVWLFIALLALAYLALLRRTRRASPGEAAGRARAGAFAAGLALLWIALDWPIGALGAGYLASAHMIQFLLIALGAPPLLLWGVPPAAYEPLRGDSMAARAARFLTHPLIALAVFNIIVGTTHTPAVTDALMPTQLGSFAVDMAWLAGALLFWWPVAAPVPERPLFNELVKIGYVTAQEIVMTPVFAYLTYSAHPVYALYELAPPVHGIGALDDQRVAGLIMKVVGGLVLMGAVTVLFFRWAKRTGDDPEALAAAGTAGATGASPAGATATGGARAAQGEPAPR